MTVRPVLPSPSSLLLSLCLALGISVPMVPNAFATAPLEPDSPVVSQDFPVRLAFQPALNGSSGNGVAKSASSGLARRESLRDPLAEQKLRRVLDAVEPGLPTQRAFTITQGYVESLKQKQVPISPQALQAASGRPIAGSNLETMLEQTRRQTLALQVLNPVKSKPVGGVKPPIVPIVVMDMTNTGAQPLSRFTARPTWPVLAGIRLLNPLPAGTVSSPFGLRWGRPHDGADLSAPEGTFIYAAAPGVVTHVGDAGGYGLMVEIAHQGAGALKTRYAHCSHTSVALGQRVMAGQIIAAVGSTGHVTGPHLHFEVLVNQLPIDPLPMIVNLAKR